MMVDVFCGILSGSAFGKNIKRWQGDDERVANLVTKGFLVLSILKIVTELRKSSKLYDKFLKYHKITALVIILFFVRGSVS